MILKNRKLTSQSIMALLAMGFSSLVNADVNTESLEKIAKGEHRSTENIERNIYRNPVEVLEFFDVQPDQTVVEVSPGGGWYSEILGPYLKEQGHLYLAIFSDTSERSYAPSLNDKIKKMTADKSLYGKVDFTVIDTPKVTGPVAPAGSADRVLTFRNIHTWLADGKADEAFKEFYTALKPGGVLGIVQHRAKPDHKTDSKESTGYVREEHVIALAEKAGFKFVANSEVNANYKDTSEHPNGVWTLPPSLRLKNKTMTDEERYKYLAIGESDRMTLKFIKPAQK